MDAGARVEAALAAALEAVGKGASTSDITRAALRVAVLRQDYVAELWLRSEIAGARPSTQRAEDLRPLLGKLAALLGEQESEKQRTRVMEQFIARRTFSDGAEDKVLPLGVAELEVHERSLRAIYDAPIQAGMTPIDTGLASIDREKARTAVGPMLLQEQSMLERIRDAAYQYLVDVESQLIAGDSTPNVIARGHAFVEERLAAVSPAALDALLAAQDRSQAEGAEALSHTATSCRRAIKALADALYPPGKAIVDDTGVERVMDDDHYRNRLTEYVRQRKGRSTHADLLASNLTSLGTRLKSLDDLASKGVHGAVSVAEAESCLSWTYMLAADLLRVTEETGL